ncbi:EXS family-domain-containing protein [Scenedesmus sp. NREL 46B-D3]|nr:EXS family-domain-containing protein [Scenedesmus sp. NREL 46B-D3]
MVINSCYSFYWDVEQDWGMPWLMPREMLYLLYCPGGAGGRKFGPLRAPMLKGSHTYSSGWYVWLLLSNLLLRFTWAHRLLGDLEAHSEVLMAVAMLEVLRRWQWVFVRVETETRKLGLLAPPQDGLGVSNSGDGLAQVVAGAGVSRVALSSDGMAFGGDGADVKMSLHEMNGGHVH